MALVATLVAVGSADRLRAEEPYITIGWAQWGPADALLQLAADFTAETGIEVRGEFIPWPLYQERVYAELNAGGDGFDLLLGDSQWLGAGVRFGHYVELTDFLASNGIDLTRDFAPLTVAAYAEWPKASKRYWSLPAQGDAVGWSYRKDWFERKDLQSAFHAKYGYELKPPANWLQMRDIARFFENRKIDGKTVHGLALFTEPEGDSITMGVSSALYAWGVTYDPKTRDLEHSAGLDTANAAEALAFYRELYECCTPPHSQSVHVDASLKAFENGEVAMAMNFFAFFPALAGNPAMHAVTGYFANPPMKADGATLGGQGMSIVAYSKKQDLARRFIKWFARADVQKRWWQLGGFSCHKAVLHAEDFDSSAPYAPALRQSLVMVRDFWQSPLYAELLETSQHAFYDYIVRGKGEAQAVLNGVVAEWGETFADESRLPFSQ